MVLVLIIGDLHIPHRAAGIPETFRKLFSQGGRINQIICCGNMCNKETYDYLRTITTNITCVRGEYDEYPANMEDTEVIDIEELRVGVVHGHQVVPWGDKDALAIWQRKLDVDILISGNTHQCKYFEFDSHLFSQSGVYYRCPSVFDCDVAPSFMLLDIHDSNVICFMYTMDGAEMKLKKKEWKKE